MCNHEICCYSVNASYTFNIKIRPFFLQILRPWIDDKDVKTYQVFGFNRRLSKYRKGIIEAVIKSGWICRFYMRSIKIKG